MRNSLFVLVILMFSIPVFSQNGKSTKRGIAYGYHSAADMAAVSKGLCWWYNWSHQPESGVAAVYQNYNMDFVPMTWNGSFNEAGLKAYYKSHPDARYLLAFNEPNFTSQANMTPKQVAAQWPRLEAIADTYNLKIVGPAVNYCDKCITVGGVAITSPVAYLDSFFIACPDCRVDYIAVHNYMCYSGALSSYIDGFKKFGKKIWLTEYACWDQSTITPDMQKSYMKSSIDYLEKDTMVFRYAWFTGSRNGAWPYLDIYAPQSGKLTELGQFYVDYRAFIPDTSYYAPVPDRIEAEHFTSMFGTTNEAVTDFDGVDDVGYIDAGDWLEYNIYVPATATYYAYFRIAGTASSSIYLRIDGQNTDTLKVASTGGWQNWKTFGIPTDLPQGKHKLRLYTPTGKFNLNWIRISDHANTAPTANAGADQVITLPENTAVMAGEGTDNENDSIRFQWTKISGPASFAFGDQTSPNTTVSGLVKGRYIFKLTISDGTDLATDQLTVDVVYPVGIDRNFSSIGAVFPNPVESKLYIQNPSLSGETHLMLMDASGRMVLSKACTETVENLELDLSGIKDGYYILKIESNRGTEVHPVVKL